MKTNLQGVRGAEASLQGVRGAEGVWDTFATLRQAKEAYLIDGKVEDELATMGILDPLRPTYEPEHTTIFSGVSEGEYFDGRMPTVVKRLSLDQLSHLYGLLQGWYAYVQGKYGIWKTRKSQTKEIKGVTEAFCRKGYRESGQSDENSRVLAKQDIRFIEANAEFEKASAILDILEAQMKTASKNLDLISREITLRGYDIQAGARHRGFNRSLRYAEDGPEQERGGGYAQAAPKASGAGPKGPKTPRGNSRGPVDPRRKGGAVQG